jgi:pimeloyl-ACP methyl ester carboxylesterase
VRVVGTSGPAVLLLPGGAEAVEGFFPALVEGLADCRVVLLDRPGTGTSTVEGCLADAADAVHAMLAELGVGPVVAIGQSLGGVVATLLARDHPDDVAGLVLLDASPVNDAALARKLEQSMRSTLRLLRVPFAERALRATLRATSRRSIARHGMGPAEAAAMMTMAEVDMRRLGRAAAGLEEIAREFSESQLPRVPAAVVTADRKPDSGMHRAHGRLADALGAPLLSWPGAEHSVHLTHPAEVLEACRTVVRAVS